jgi:1,4-dihydroxy-2-naphthoyl-CoA hydrolase
MVGLLHIQSDWHEIEATMPVDSRTHQPFAFIARQCRRILGSVRVCILKGAEGCGLEVNANHIRSVRSGRVRGVCRALHAGSSHQVWQMIFSMDRTARRG